MILKCLFSKFGAWKKSVIWQTIVPNCEGAINIPFFRSSRILPKVFQGDLGRSLIKEVKRNKFIANGSVEVIVVGIF